MNRNRQRNASTRYCIAVKINMNCCFKKCCIGKQSRLRSTVVMGVAIILASTNHQADAQVTFELDEPILTHFDDDFSSETWNTLGAGVAKLDSVNGDLVIDRTSMIPGVPDDFDVVYVEHANALLTDVSIRAEMQMLKEDRTGTYLSATNPAVTLASRTCFADIEKHVCGGNENSWIYADLFETGEIHSGQNTQDPSRITPTDLRPLEENVVLQLDTFGDNAKIWAWRAGEPRPAEPLVEYTAADNPTSTPGGIMFGTLMADALFRWVHISPTPIPGDVPGDTDGDGAVTARDIDGFAVGGGPLFDLNNDRHISGNLGSEAALAPSVPGTGCIRVDAVWLLVSTRLLPTPKQVFEWDGASVGTKPSKAATSTTTNLHNSMYVGSDSHGRLNRVGTGCLRSGHVTGGYRPLHRRGLYPSS